MSVFCIGVRMRVSLFDYNCCVIFRFIRSNAHPAATLQPSCKQSAVILQHNQNYFQSCHKLITIITTVNTSSAAAIITTVARKDSCCSLLPQPCCSLELCGWNITANSPHGNFCLSISSPTSSSAAPHSKKPLRESSTGMSSTSIFS